MRLYGGYYLSLPPATNSMRFLEQYVSRWQTNWEAGRVEEGLLQRLWVEAPKLADELWCKLAANPANIKSTRWAVWKSLMRDRRKAEASEFAAREQIKTGIEFSSSFPCLPFQAPDVLVFWPDKVSPPRLRAIARCADDPCAEWLNRCGKWARTFAVPMATARRWNRLRRVLRNLMHGSWLTTRMGWVSCQSQPRLPISAWARAGFRTAGPQASPP